MAQTWAPEDEEGFGIRGEDEDALTDEQQKSLNDLRVQTARDNQEYLHDHPEVKAMLSLLIRETFLQERDVRSVAGDLFRSEKHVVAAVRRMLSMSPTPMSKLKRRPMDEGICLKRDVTFSATSVRKGRQRDVPSKPPDKPRITRRDTPAPWIHSELLKLTEEAGDIASELTGHNLSWLHQELENLASGVDGRSTQGAGQQGPWVHSGKSSSQMRDAIAGDDLGEGEEDYIPLGRRDTPAPWSVVEDIVPPEKKDKEKYVLRLLEKILEEPAAKNDADVFDKLEKIVEEVE